MLRPTPGPERRRAVRRRSACSSPCGRSSGPRTCSSSPALVFAVQAVRPCRDARARSAAFAIFCALSGVVYLSTTSRIATADRQHPLKRLRPIAAGDAPGRTRGRRRGRASARLALVGAVLPRLTLRRRRGRLPGAAQTLYSASLKHIVIIDVLTIAAGFVLRAIAGAVVDRRRRSAIGCSSARFCSRCSSRSPSAGTS